MLLELHVKNLALIERADVEFGEGLNILTGETGAGKSIIIAPSSMLWEEGLAKDAQHTPRQPDYLPMHRARFFQSREKTGCGRCGNWIQNLPRMAW